VQEVSFAKGSLLVDVLISSNIISSKTEWRRLISEGAVTNIESGEKIGNPESSVENTTYKIGKKRFLKIKVV
jgi:tyrosyl-tRNA synthetase